MMNNDPQSTATLLAGLSPNTDQAQLIDDLKKSLTEEMEKEYKLLQELCDYCKPSKSEEKEKDKPVDDVKDVAAIKKFQNSPIAGSILIHHDFEKLFDILKGMTIGASLSSNNKKDEENFEIILKAYKFKNRKKGSRQIKMVLDNEFDIHFNLKKIQRLMRKFGLKCPIRKANPYRRMMKATKEHSTCENLVNRNFKTGKPYNVLLTDITYIFYNNKKCYLSTVKDGETNEILAYYISEKLTLDISLETIKKLHRNKNILLCNKVKIHSDQVVHYTSPKFHELLKKYNIQQSMSRRGNCWDNAPQESYFGHMKDELNLETCFTFRDVCNEIKDYIEYYNNYRYQWNLKKMTPVKYRNHLLENLA